MVVSWLSLLQKCAVSSEQTCILVARVNLGATLAGCNRKYLQSGPCMAAAAAENGLGENSGLVLGENSGLVLGAPP